MSKTVTFFLEQHHNLETSDNLCLFNRLNQSIFEDFPKISGKLSTEITGRLTPHTL